MKRILLCLLLWTPASQNLRANSPAQSLLANLSAKTHALGGASCAETGGAAQSFLRNPASLASLKEGEASATFTGGPFGTKLFQTGYAAPHGRAAYDVEIAGALFPEEERRDTSGTSLGSFRNSDFSFGAAFGRSWRGIAYGLDGIAFRKSAAGIASTAFAVGGGLRYQLHRRLACGLRVNDLTLKPFQLGRTGEPFPTEAAAGLALLLCDREELELQSTADVAAAAGGSPGFNFGSELKINGIFFLRGGLDSRSSGGRIGAGLALGKIRLDWSLELHPLGAGDFMHFTVGYRL